MHCKKEFSFVNDDFFNGCNIKSLKRDEKILKGI